MVTPELVEAKQDVIKESDVVLVQLEIPMETVECISEITDQYQIPLIINPAPYQSLSDEVYKRAAYITPNETESPLMNINSFTSSSLGSPL